MDRRSVAPPISKSIFSTGRSALDPSCMTPLTIMSFASEWHFKPEGVNLVKKRFEVELARLEQALPWDFQVENRWVPEHGMWQVRCAKDDYNRVWRAFFVVMNGVIREAVHSASQEGGDEGDDKPTADDEDADEDYDFGRDHPLESKLIQRLAVWKMQSILGGPIAEVESADQPEETDTQLTAVAPDESFPAEIRFYKFRQAWKCADKSIMLDDLFPEADLQELVRLTSSQFSKDINEGIVFVGAHEEENLLLAVHKLDNIEKNWQYRHPWANHIFYNEEIGNARYVLKYFVDIKMFYFETTLLDNLQVTFSNGACDYETLTNAIAVRCAPMVPVKSEYIPIKKLNIPKIKVEDLLGGVRVFSTAYTYNGKGASSDNPMLHRPAHIAECSPDPAVQTNVQQLQKALAPHLRNATLKDDSVQRWATAVPDAISSGIAPPLIGLHNAFHIFPSGTVANTGDQGISAQKADWDRYEEYRPEKTAKIVEKEIYWKTQKGSVGLINRNLTSNVHPVSGAHANVPKANVVSPQPNVGMPRSASMPQVTTSDGLMEPLKPIILHRQPLKPVVELKPRQPIVSHQLPQIHTRSASQTSTVPLPGRSISGPLFSESVARRNRVQMSLLDEEDPVIESLQAGILEPVPRVWGLQNQTEKKQLVPESETRIFHRTMNQRAPRPTKLNPFAGRLERPFSPPKSTTSSKSNSPTDPLPEFVEEINQSFKELMTGLRGYRGKVVVQAEFGRIILGRFHPKQLSVKGKDHLLDGAYLQKILLEPTEYGPTVDFTSVLTAVPAEIQFMVNMKGSGDQNLWEMNKVSKWNTSYEFVFTDPRDPLYPVMVEIDAETFIAQIKARCRLGNIFIHGTKRHWDVKVAAIGYGNNRALEDKYGDLATAIQSSLYIPPSSHRPYLAWQLDESLQTNFVIQEVTVRRVYEYKSTDQKSILKVSELQSLDIDGGPVTEQSFWIYEAKPGNPDRAPIDKLTTWYEACVSSVQLDASFEQNESLDLGDETVWTLEDIANMEASKALYSPVLDMLKQMDGVGQHSHNGSDYRSRAPADHVMQAQVTKNPVVWW
ncbi:hypothetical protein IFR05_004940 [Cadophora sp. M221]|nr:hypothetical protein IFR05_004940 [Cadophora sp. M221]